MQNKNINEGEKEQKRNKKGTESQAKRVEDKWREKVPNRIPLEAERDNLSEEERCHLHCEHTLITPSLPLSHTQSLTLPPSFSSFLIPSLHHTHNTTPSEKRSENTHSCLFIINLTWLKRPH